MSEKDVICDASSLISLSDACNLGLLSELSAKMKGQFIVPEQVKVEIVDHPIEIKRFEWSAIRLQRMIKEGDLIVENTDEKMVQNLLQLSNSIYSVDGKPLEIMHSGECGALALMKKVGTSNLLIDEKTTRLLIEKPERLAKHLEERYKKKVKVNKQALGEFRKLAGDVKIFRSTELAIVAYELGIFDKYEAAKKDALEATLYSLKYSGCGVSFEELAEFLEK